MVLDAVDHLFQWPHSFFDREYRLLNEELPKPHLHVSVSADRYRLQGTKPLNVFVDVGPEVNVRRNVTVMFEAVAGTERSAREEQLHDQSTLVIRAFAARREVSRWAASDADTGGRLVRLEKAESLIDRENKVHPVSFAVFSQQVSHVAPPNHAAAEECKAPGTVSAYLLSSQSLCPKGRARGWTHGKSHDLT